MVILESAGASSTDQLRVLRQVLNSLVSYLERGYECPPFLAAPLSGRHQKGGFDFKVARLCLVLLLMKVRMPQRRVQY